MACLDATGARLTHRDVLRIAVPMILANATTPLTGLAETAVIGQLNDPAAIGAVALGATIFSMLFWAFGFLRMGTTGLVAQAAGAGDRAEVSATLLRALVIALAAGFGLFLVQVPAIAVALNLIGGSTALQTGTAAYFGIRIFSAPATLANYALLGWFIGLARARIAFLLQLLLNSVNIFFAILLVLVARKGVEGAAMAAVIAEYCALAAGLLLAWPHYGGPAGKGVRIFSGAAFRRLLAVNGDIMIRTVCMMFAFTFFAAEGAKFGDVTLAANSILRNLSDLSAYILDGFAFAAEVLAGQAAGSGSLSRFREAVALSSLWAAALALFVSLVLFLGGVLLISGITGALSVREAAARFLPWAALTPVAGVTCFQLDGIFIGATRTADMRNMMILSLAIFLAAFAVLTPAFGNHGLWAALIVFYIARALTLGVRYPALERATFKIALPKRGLPS